MSDVDEAPQTNPQERRLLTWENTAIVVFSLLLVVALIAAFIFAVVISIARNSN